MARPWNLIAALLLLLCFGNRLSAASATDVPEPTIPSPPSRTYRDDLHDTAKNVQSSTPLYSFSMKPETDLVNSVAESGDANCSDFMAGDSSSCHLYQGLIVAIVMPVALGILFFLCCTGFCMFRNCSCCKCKLCCNNCGGKAPRQEGYSKVNRGVCLAIYASLVILIIIFAGLGIGSATQLSETSDRLFDSILDFSDASSQYISGISTFINVQSTEIQTVVLNGQNGLESSMQGIRNEKTALVDRMSAMAFAIQDMQNTMRTATGQAGATCSFCTSTSATLYSARNSLEGLEIKNVTLSSGTNVAEQIQSSTKPVVDSLDSAKSSFTDVNKDVTSTRDDFRSGERSVETASTVLFGVSIVSAVLTVFGVFFRKGWMWWCPFVILNFQILVLWIVVGVTYSPSYLLNGICDLAPSPDNGGKALANLLDGDAKSQVEDFIDQCLVSDSGSLFDVFNVSRDIFDDAFKDFSLSKQINVSSITDGWDTSSFQEVQNSQANVQNMTLEQVLPSASWTQAQTDLNTVNSGLSILYYYSNISACTTICSSGAKSTAKTNLIPYESLAQSIEEAKTNSTAILSSQATLSNSVSNVQTEVQTIDTNIATSINNVISGFFSLGKCSWLGKGYNNIRLSVCDGFGSILSAMWFCAGTLAIFGLLFMLWLPAMNKRFSRQRGPAEQEATGGGKKMAKSTTAAYEMSVTATTGVANVPGVQASAPPVEADFMEVPDMGPANAPVQPAFAYANAQQAPMQQQQQAQMQQFPQYPVAYQQSNVQQQGAYTANI